MRFLSPSVDLLIVDGTSIDIGEGGAGNDPITGRLERTGPAYHEGTLFFFVRPWTMGSTLRLVDTLNKVRDRQSVAVGSTVVSDNLACPACLKEGEGKRSSHCGERGKERESERTGRKTNCNFYVFVKMSGVGDDKNVDAGPAGGGCPAEKNDFFRPSPRPRVGKKPCTSGSESSMSRGWVDPNPNFGAGCGVPRNGVSGITPLVPALGVGGHVAERYVESTDRGSRGQDKTSQDISRNASATPAQETEVKTLRSGGLDRERSGEVTSGTEGRSAGTPREESVRRRSWPCVSSSASGVRGNED